MNVCNIMGVNIVVTDLPKIVRYIEENLNKLRGDYICVSNVHTTVMSFESSEYQNIQNDAAIALPDGGPLSVVAKIKGYKECERVTGPDLMGEIFSISSEKKYRHYFYGSTEKTLQTLKKKLEMNYSNIEIVGMYSPPFRELTLEENKEIISMINDTNPDFVWVGLGAPKQEIWMNKNKTKINALMIGVGAGFDYYSENIKRAPIWMQKLCLEWFYRLLQDPKRLYKRYIITNTKFLIYILKDIF